MAKFCTKCGKELKEGKACDCSKEKVVATKVASTNANEYVNNYLEVLKGVFKAPIDTISKWASSNNFTLAVIALLINCIVSGLYLYCLCKESIGLFYTYFGGYSSLLTSSALEVPFVKTVLYGIIFMAAGFAVTAIMIYIIANAILKDKIDMKKSFALVGVCSVFTTVTTLVALISIYISIKLMLIILLVAGIFYLTYLYQGISEVTEVNKNKLAYVFVPAISIATFVVVYILPKILI